MNLRAGYKSAERKQSQECKYFPHSLPHVVTAVREDKAVSHSAGSLISARDLRIFGRGTPRSFAKCVAM